MNQIILASHGGLAAGAKDTLEMVLGDVSNVHVVSLARDDKEPITNKVEAMIATFNADDTVYVLTDMLGSSVNNNMVELVIANNDDMALGAIAALQAAGYNNGTGKTIPVFGVDATDSAKQLINEGKMTGTIKQDAEGMANAISTITQNMASGKATFEGIDSANVVGTWRVNIPYSSYTGE